MAGGGKSRQDAVGVLWVLGQNGEAEWWFREIEAERSVLNGEMTFIKE